MLPYNHTMEFSRNTRTRLICLLLIALFGLLVFGGIDRPPAPELGHYPDAYEIAESPNKYQNQRVGVGGRVLSTDPVIVRAEYRTDTGIKTIRLWITDVDVSVSQGDTVRVFGILTDSQTVQAIRIVEYPQTGQWYAWVTSFIGGLWVLTRIVKHWKIDIPTGAFIPRLEMLQLFQ